MKRTLLIQQMDERMRHYSAARRLPYMPWIKATRKAMGMTQSQLGARLGISAQALGRIEAREARGEVTLKVLKRVAAAMGMELRYGLIPERYARLSDMIETSAQKVAYDIVMETSNSMYLEGQGNSPKRLKRAIKERASYIKEQKPKVLWS